MISAYLSFFVCFVSSLEQKMGLRSPKLGLSIMNVKKETGSFFNPEHGYNLHSFIKNRYYDCRGVAAKYLQTFLCL